MSCQHSDEALKKAFNDIDTDGSGSVDKSEIKKMVMNLGMCEADADKIAEDVMKDDPNKDGKFTLDEFMQVMKK